MRGFISKRKDLQGNITTTNVQDGYKTHDPGLEFPKLIPNISRGKLRHAVSGIFVQTHHNPIKVLIGCSKKEAFGCPQWVTFEFLSSLKSSVELPHDAWKILTEKSVGTDFVQNNLETMDIFVESDICKFT